MPLRETPAYAGGSARAAALALVAALVAGILVVLLPASPDRASEVLCLQECDCSCVPRKES
jgi:hypothetical protein